MKHLVVILSLTLLPLPVFASDGNAWTPERDRTRMADEQRETPGDEYWWDGFDRDGIGGHTSYHASCSVVYDGKLIIGGEFTTAGSLDVGNIAIWDGNSWSTFGSGFTGYMARVRALAVYNGDLIVGGDFEHVDGQSISNLARWDGETWHSMGNFSNDVWCLLPFNGNLIAGGIFQAVDNQPRWFISSWNGTSWSALGEYGLSGMVYCLAECQGSLIAGGSFRTAYNVPGSRDEFIMVEHIARWDGLAWQDLGGGLNDVVWGMGVFQDQLYAGGDFTGTILGEELSHAAVWDGQDWAQAGDGVDGRAYAFKEYGGKWYVAGQITGYNGVPFNNIARLSDGEWLPLGSGIVGNRVYDLATYQNSLYAGGWFEYAGDKPSRNIARWDWDPLTSIASAPTPAPRTALKNFPNPFNPTTVIRYTLPEPSDVRLSVFSPAGRRVRVLRDGPSASGDNELVWDGLDSEGAPLPSGVYLCRLEFGDESCERKMTLAR